MKRNEDQGANAPSSQSVSHHPIADSLVQNRKSSFSRSQVVQNLVLPDIQAEPVTRTTERLLITWAKSLAVGVRDVLAQCLSGLSAIKAQAVTTPALPAVFDTSPGVLAADLQAHLNSHVCAVVVDLRVHELARRWL